MLSVQSRKAMFIFFFLSRTFWIVSVWMEVNKLHKTSVNSDHSSTTVQSLYKAFPHKNINNSSQRSKDLLNLKNWRLMSVIIHHVKSNRTACKTEVKRIFIFTFILSKWRSFFLAWCTVVYWKVKDEEETIKKKSLPEW